MKKHLPWENAIYKKVTFSIFLKIYQYILHWCMYYISKFPVGQMIFSMSNKAMKVMCFHENLGFSETPYTA